MCAGNGRQRPHSLQGDKQVVLRYMSLFSRLFCIAGNRVIMILIILKPMLEIFFFFFFFFVSFLPSSSSASSSPSFLLLLVFILLLLRSTTVIGSIMTMFEMKSNTGHSQTGFRVLFCWCLCKCVPACVRAFWCVLACMCVCARACVCETVCVVCAYVNISVCPCLSVLCFCVFLLRIFALVRAQH